MDGVTDETIGLNLTRAEALVLFDWLSRCDGSGSFGFEDDAEQKVLWVVEAQLERVLTEPLSPDYRELLASARRRVKSA